MTTSPFPDLLSPVTARRLLLVVLGLGLLAAACSDDEAAAFDDGPFDGLPVGSAEVVSGDDLDFIEISPFATFGSAQGDFMAGPHGTFGIFGAGAASPAHTHSGAYYAVVLAGEMNNPFGTEAAPPALAPGSFWAVPADEQHVTACLTPDRECRFFFHATSAFDFAPIDGLTAPRADDAAAIAVDALDFQALEPFSAAATVWGEPASGAHGFIGRLEEGTGSGRLAYRNAVTMVPLTGSLELATDGDAAPVGVGSLIEAEANTPHTVTCGDGVDCLFYVFSAQSRELAVR